MYEVKCNATIEKANDVTIFPTVALSVQHCFLSLPSSLILMYNIQKIFGSLYNIIIFGSLLHIIECAI